MTSITNLLKFLEENWSQIIIILALAFTVYKKWQSFSKMSEKEKVDTAILIVSEIILEKLAKAEEDWINYKKTGTIKRSKVINEIYEQYPVLKTYADQEYIINKIDEFIDEGLKNLEKTIKDIKEQNTQSEVKSEYYA